MFVLMISRSDSNWITWGEKLGHRAKSKENLVDTLEVTFLSNQHESCSKCLSMISRSFESRSLGVKS